MTWNKICHAAGGRVRMGPGKRLAVTSAGRVLLSSDPPFCSTSVCISSLFLPNTKVKAAFLHHVQINLNNSAIIKSY